MEVQLLDSIAACGDVNRNVMRAPIPSKPSMPRRWRGERQFRSLTPNTSAYHEIGSTERCIAGGEDVDDPYSPTYCRESSIAVAVPPYNDVDVFALDLGFIAIPTRPTASWGTTSGRRRHGHGPRGATTYPRTADVHRLLHPRRAVDVAECCYGAARLRRPARS